MKRDIDLKEISDGRLYGLNDMVKADCKDCEGCYSCCQGMGKSVVLDPFDCYRLTRHLSCSMEMLLLDKLELNVVDGIILPNLNMSGEEERCGFLDEKGRCSIHSSRPGICRLFPLGRIYEEDGFRYFLQIHECRMEKRSKVKVRKWIDTPDLKRYETFIYQWHCLLKELEEKIAESKDLELANKISVLLLKTFYLTSYESEEDFFRQFDERRSFAFFEKA